MPRVFFYGLFMDVDLLTQKALKARTIGMAELPDFELRIGERATLIQCAGAVSYGMLIDMGDDDLRQLYAEASVSDYRAEAVRVRLLSDASEHVAQCYNLPQNLLGDSVNTVYARRLASLVAQLGFPPDYVAYIDAIAKARTSAPDDHAE